MKIKLRMFFPLLCIVIGIVIFLYPTTMKEINEVRDRKEIEVFQQTIKKEIESKDKTDKTRIYESLYREMKEYNNEIYENGQEGLFDPFSSPDNPFNLSQFGLKEDMIGYITIPRLNLAMKLYLGATKEHLSEGIGVLSNTSMPLGGNNTNCVLAGHRGSKTKKFFYGIEKLEVGDEIELTTPWNDLTYKVESVKVITPNQVDTVMIQDGKDMITLITCHPYGKNYQRYLVYATRKEKNKVNNNENKDINREECLEKTENWNESEGKNESEKHSVVQSEDVLLSIEEVIRKAVLFIFTLFIMGWLIQTFRRNKKGDEKSEVK